VAAVKGYVWLAVRNILKACGFSKECGGRSRRIAQSGLLAP
jgi:hypothetical protein